MQKLNPLELEQIKELYTIKGKSLAEISIKLGLSLPTIRKYINKECLLSHSEFLLDYFIIRYLRKNGVIKITPENEHYPFQVSEEDVKKIIEEENKLLGLEFYREQVTEKEHR